MFEIDIYTSHEYDGGGNDNDDAYDSVLFKGLYCSEGWDIA